MRVTEHWYSKAQSDDRVFPSLADDLHPWRYSKAIWMWSGHGSGQLAKGKQDKLIPRGPFQPQPF